MSRLALGGGGIGQLWGETSREEAAATIRLAVDSGIDLIDTAPIYRNCEAIIGEVFGGKLPSGVRITSKCFLGSPPPREVEARIAASLDATLAALRLERVDLYFLHSNICEDDYVYAMRPHRQSTFATTWSLYTEQVIPAMEKLRASGRIGAWGITGTGVPQTILRALGHAKRPAVVQAVANLLDSAGGMRSYAEPAQPRDIIRTAKQAGVGVMGIRAVQAGALTASLDRALAPDHAEERDYARAAPFRALCRELGQDPALVAHRYALALDGVDTVILGVKNRTELAQCLEAEALGPLEPDVVRRIDALGLRDERPE